MWTEFKWCDDSAWGHFELIFAMVQTSLSHPNSRFGLAALPSCGSKICFYFYFEKKKRLYETSLVAPFVFEHLANTYIATSR